MKANETFKAIRRQALDIKKQYPHTVVLIKCGDFLEAFDADAETIGAHLDRPVTQVNLSDKGFEAVYAANTCLPYHSREQYLSSLIDAGHKVAVAEPTI